MRRDLLHALGWGAAIGLVNLVWLYAAYYIGLHTNGIAVFQVFMTVWLLLTCIGFVLALRSAKRRKPQRGYLSGVLFGAAMALASAVMAVVAQVGYFKVVHPEWPEFMAKQTREHFAAQGAAVEQIAQFEAQARDYFTLSNYAVSSAVTAFILGLIVSAIAMLFLRRRPVAEAPVP